MPKKGSRSSDVSVTTLAAIKHLSPPAVSSLTPLSTLEILQTSVNNIAKNKPLAHDQHESPLFRLPWELRVLIYRTALTKDPSTSLLDLTHDNTSDLEPALLQTCRRIRHEALPVFYACNDWVVKTRRLNNRIDPETRKPVLYEIIPRWVEGLEDEKIALMGSVVVVGTRGSFVDIEGVWREGRRAAFRLRWAGRRPGYCVEDVREGEDEEEVLPESAYCGVQLVDLLRARLRCFGVLKSGERWHWTWDGIHEIACLL